MAVLEKGKAPGSHLLSGAVIDPRPLYRLLGDLRAPDTLPAYGAVEAESVLFLTPTRAIPIPVPPTMRNHGNLVVSLSRLGRWLAEAAEELGVDDPAGDLGAAAARRGRPRRRRPHRRQGPWPDGEELGRFEPGSDIRARVTILAEGTQGHLTGAALERFGLAGRARRSGRSASRRSGRSRGRCAR